MGSGQSDATAASNNSLKNPMNQCPQVSIKRQQSELEKPMQPSNLKEADDSSVSEEDMEDWMFKTFDKVKNG
jgi:hypothetical protein